MIEPTTHEAGDSRSSNYAPVALFLSCHDVACITTSFGAYRVALPHLAFLVSETSRDSQLLSPLSFCHRSRLPRSRQRFDDCYFDF